MDGFVLLDLEIIVTHSTDDELNWFDPLNYTTEQYIIVGGAIFILFCYIMGCGIYCCWIDICYKRKHCQHPQNHRYESTSAEDGPIHGFNTRQFVQLGDTVGCNFVD